MPGLALIENLRCELLRAALSPEMMMPGLVHQFLLRANQIVGFQVLAVYVLNREGILRTLRVAGSGRNSISTAVSPGGTSTRTGDHTGVDGGSTVCG